MDGQQNTKTPSGNIVLNLTTFSYAYISAYSHILTHKALLTNFRDIKYVLKMPHICPIHNENAFVNNSRLVNKIVAGDVRCVLM